MMLAQVARRPDAAPKAVFYHDVGKSYTPMGTDAAIFWRHVEALKADGVGAGHLVCFDDGFRGVWDAREEFRRRGVKPLAFLAIRLVGRAGHLTWDEARTLERECGFRFGCHTWSHQTLAGDMIDESPKAERTEEWFRRELVDSKAEIERQLGHAVDELCFPAGNFSADVVKRCAAAGYRRLYASYPGNLPTDDPAPGETVVVPRCLVQDFGAFDFKLALKGGMMAFYGRHRARHES